MKVTQEFTVASDRKSVWAFFEQPRRVAECVPGVESVEEIEPDQFRVLVTQKVGPISATFRAKVTVAEKVANESMRLVSTGQVARGAAGSFRSDIVVRLLSEGERTRVRVDGEVALAGILGSVGQSVVERQAAALARVFAENLAARLNPSSADSPVGSTEPAIPPVSVAAPVAGRAVAAAAPVAAPDLERAVARAEFWSKFAASTSAAALAVALVVLGRLLA